MSERPFARRIPRAGLALACMLGLLLFSIGCGEEAAKSPKPEKVAGWPKIRLERFKGVDRFKDANLARDALLIAASRELEGVRAKSNPQKLNSRLSEAWARYFPNFSIADQTAKPSLISAPPEGFATIKRPQGPGETYVFSFAVRDTKGRCAGGFMTGFPQIFIFRKVAITDGPCRAQRALKTALGAP